jgi:integrase
MYWALEGKFLRGHSNKHELARFAKSDAGAMALDEVTSVDVKNFKAARRLENPEIRGSTLNREQGRIMRLFNAFKEWKRQGKVGGYDFSALALPVDNPCEGLPKEDETRYRRNIVVSPEQFTRFLDYAHPETRKIAILALLTLLRRRDIQLLSKDAWNRALDVLSGTQSKTGRPYNVPVTMTVKLMLAKGEQETVVDFTNHRKRWQTACQQSGVWFQLRDLRRTGATHLLLEGIDIVTVQRYLGHTGIKMTMAYLDPPAPLKREAAKALERKFVTMTEVPSYGWNEN